MGESIKFVEQMPFNIVFQNAKGKEIGKLFETEDGELSFLGNVDEAAETFFTAVIERNHKRIKELTDG